jgi:hypothetical protein
MEDNIADVTVRGILPEIFPEVAVMIVVPLAIAVASPLLLTVPTAVLDDLQVTCVAMSRLVLSEYVPEAENCWVTPTGMLGLAGVTDMEARLLVGPVPPFPPPPHVVTNTAQKPKNIIVKENLIFFTGKFTKE